MNIFIETLPRWSGGILAHLKGILTNGFVPSDMHIIIYGTQRLFDAIGPMDKNVEAIADNSMPMNPIIMYLWRLRNIPRLLDIYKADVHFSVQGNLSKINNDRVKHVVMSRNLQPHLKEERKRLPIHSFGRFRLEVLNHTLKSSFSWADGVIFLTEYAREIIQQDGIHLKRSSVIPHGLSDNFRRQPVKKPLMEKPLILYVSDFNIYKYQWEVVRGINILRKKTGIDLKLQLVGDKSKDGWKLFMKVLSELDDPDWITVTEHVPYSDIHKVYHNADIFIFASTVETIGNILLEAMSSGLPIAYSNRRPMIDILGDGGIIFEPIEPESIASAIQRFIENDDLRFKSARSAYQRSLNYSWERTSKKTFGFIREISTCR